MAAYLQMGHQSENLVGEKGLEDFGGIILSPVNRLPSELIQDVAGFNEINNKLDIIFDPQLYFPKTKRKNLTQQPYFPKNIDSSDYSSLSWWKNINKELATYATNLSVDKIASPSILPRIFNDDYYMRCVEISNDLQKKVSKINTDVLCTVMVDINQIADESLVMRTSSILDNSDSKGFYIVLVNDCHPRIEFSDSEELMGYMYLIHLLRQTGREVIVSHCSSDMILYKCAGATHCASGKFFNLRRFTTSRFDEPSEGGGQLPYWFEHNFLAFLRDADLRRLSRRGFSSLVGYLNSNNPWSEIILAKISKRSQDGVAWLGDSWRQYLSWFGNTERMLNIAESTSLVKDWLENSNAKWKEIKSKDIDFEEDRNNGTWIRAWLNALNDFVDLR